MTSISSITTLTIFSAVILAFSGGITFESGIFKGMVESSAYRLVFTIALSGFILFNTIFALLYLVGKMAGKPISTRCKYIVTENGYYEQCQSCGDGYCTKECAEVSIACKIFHKYTYVFVVNSILLYVLYSDFFLWLSKGNLCDPKFFIAQSAIFLLMALTIVVYLVRKHRRLVRIRLHYKVLILRDIIEPQIQKSSFTRLSEILTKAIYGTSTTQSVKEAFLEKVSGMSKDSALQYLDEFIDAYLLSDYRLSISVTEREHKVDKKEWKRLESKFNPPIDESLK